MRQMINILIPKILSKVKLLRAVRRYWCFSQLKAFSLIAKTYLHKEST